MNKRRRWKAKARRRLWQLMQRADCWETRARWRRVPLRFHPDAFALMWPAPRIEIIEGTGHWKDAS